MQLPALGVILVNRERLRPIQTSICASQCGIVLPEGLRIRMEFSWAYAEERAKQGDTSRIARMLPHMTEAERIDARQAAGPIPKQAVEAARETMASSSSSSRNPNVKASPQPSTAPEAKAKKKPRRQGGSWMSIFSLRERSMSRLRTI